jgi:apolipoprotein D and lipocalin family protein
VPRLIAALLLLLAACTPAPVQREGFRRDGPIYSNAVLDLSTLSGTWPQVASFAAPGKPACTPGSVTLTPGPSGLTLAARLCLNGEDLALGGPLRITGPGRLTPAKAPAPLNREWWLLWADGDLRTLVIGTPDGSFGFVLNRGGPIPSDRLNGARDVFTWNGYDLSRFLLFP